MTFMEEERDLDVVALTRTPTLIEAKPGEAMHLLRDTGEAVSRCGQHLTEPFVVRQSCRWCLQAYDASVTKRIRKRVQEIVRPDLGLTGLVALEAAQVMRDAVMAILNEEAQQ